MTVFPDNPIIGDSYFDPVFGEEYVFNGYDWTSVSHFKNYKFPTATELKRYPTLKEVWEEYLIIRKLLGI